MSHLSHPVKAESIAIFNFEDCRTTEIHKQGCKHGTKACRVHEVMFGQEPHENDGYSDDWYHVAPCARRAS